MLGAFLHIHFGHSNSDSSLQNIHTISFIILNNILLMPLITFAQDHTGTIIYDTFSTLLWYVQKCNIMQCSNYIVKYPQNTTQQSIQLGKYSIPIKTWRLTGWSSSTAETVKTTVFLATRWSTNVLYGVPSNLGRWSVTCDIVILTVARELFPSWSEAWMVNWNTHHHI